MFRRHSTPESQQDPSVPPADTTSGMDVVEMALRQQPADHLGPSQATQDLTRQLYGDGDIEPVDEAEVARKQEDLDRFLKGKKERDEKVKKTSQLMRAAMRSDGLFGLAPEASEVTLKSLYGTDFKPPKPERRETWYERQERVAEEAAAEAERRAAQFGRKLRDHDERSDAPTRRRGRSFDDEDVPRRTREPRVARGTERTTEPEPVIVDPTDLALHYIAGETRRDEDHNVPFPRMSAESLAAFYEKRLKLSGEDAWEVGRHVFAQLQASGIISTEYIAERGFEVDSEKLGEALEVSMIPNDDEGSDEVDDPDDSDEPEE